jgi:hypothetical protein
MEQTVQLTTLKKNYISGEEIHEKHGNERKTRFCAFKKKCESKSTSYALKGSETNTCYV